LQSLEMNHTQNRVGVLKAWAAQELALAELSAFGCEGDRLASAASALARFNARP
jgi:hypothetical protein